MGIGIGWDGVEFGRFRASPPLESVTSGLLCHSFALSLTTREGADDMNVLLAACDCVAIFGSALLAPLLSH